MLMHPEYNAEDELLQYTTPGNQFGGYVTNWWHRNGQTVVGQFPELEDVVQEGFLVLHKVVAAYGSDIENQKHLMALFKTAWSRHITDSQRKYMKGPLPTSLTITKVHSNMEELREYDALPMHEEQGDQFVQTLVSRAKGEVKEVLDVFLKAPAEVLSEAEQSFKGSMRAGKKSKLAYSNKFLCALVGKNPRRVDLAEKIYDYFSS